MVVGFVPRFVLEAGFLLLLGAGAGYADLRPAVVVALLAGGWLLVSLIEVAVWRAQTRTVPGYRAPQAQPEPELEVARQAEPHAEPAPELVETDYPLRTEAGDAPSEEVEAYTRVLGAAEERAAGGDGAGDGE